MLLGVGIAILSPDVASGPAFAVELQKFDPTQCQAASGENNQDCVRNWYVEYSAGLIG
ncbi:MAG: hypothetical protein JOY67_20685, partial [Hyphomicrobiales bacterium]|nr:hypothetical protein [Hyphomicrobiales bacterium]